MSRRRGDDILFKMFEVLHISVHHVQPMLENIGISSLEGIEGRRFKLLPVKMVEGGRVAFTQGPKGRQIPDGFHPNQADAGFSGALEQSLKLNQGGCILGQAFRAPVIPTGGRNSYHRLIIPTRFD